MNAKLLFLRRVMKLAQAKPTPWDNRPIALDTQTRPLGVYEGPGTVGAFGGPTMNKAEQNKSEMDPTKQWQSALDKIKGK